MNLTCRTQLTVQLQFCFFKDGSTLGLSWTDTPELQITDLKRKDSGSYWCEAQTAALKVIRSRKIWIDVLSECLRGPLLGG